MFILGLRTKSDFVFLIKVFHTKVRLFCQDWWLGGCTTSTTVCSPWLQNLYYGCYWDISFEVCTCSQTYEISNSNDPYFSLSPWIILSLFLYSYPQVVEGSNQKPARQQPPSDTSSTPTPPTTTAASTTPAVSTAPDAYSNVSDLAASVAAAAMGSLASMSTTATTTTSSSLGTPITSTPNTTPARFSTPQGTPPSAATGLAAAIASIVALPGTVSGGDVLSQAMLASSTPQRYLW